MTKPYSPELLREIDAALDVACFDGGKYVGLMKRGMWYRPNAAGYTNKVEEAGRYLIGDAIKHTTNPDLEDAVTAHPFPPRHFTTDPAASDALDDKLVEICGEDGYWISKRGDEFQLVACLSGKDAIVRMPTKKLVKSVALLRLMAPNCNVLKR